MKDSLFIGIDIGGTKTAVAIGDADGQVIVETRFATEGELDPLVFIDRIVDEAAALLSPIPGALAGVGIACVGPLSRDQGMILGPPNLPQWQAVPLVERVGRGLAAPVWLDNDANLAALGEHRFGAGQGVSDLVYFTVSTGIGGGVIVNGKLIHGVGDGAGEVGHQTVVPGGPLCGCGNYGCLEAVASGTGIARRAAEMVAADPSAAAGLLARVNGDVTQLTASHVAHAAQAGDPLGGRIWGEAMYYLGLGVGNVISILAPQRVVLGGGMIAAGDLLFEPVRATVKRHVRMVPTDPIAIVPAALGQDSALRGALALAVDNAAVRA